MSKASRLVKPEHQELLRLEVLRTARLSPHYLRITLGGGEIERFRPMGYDQWFRLFLPLGGDEGLDRLPAKASSLFGYLKYLRIPEGVRPVMRNYTVREYRGATDAAGPELDVDFVLHGSAEDGTAGPAAGWAERAEPGESVVIIDEGLAFNPSRGVERVLLASDETGLPAIAGVCASLPAHAVGLAIVEVPSEADALEFAHPAGVEVRWIVRGADSHDKPGVRALAALRESALPGAQQTGAQQPAAPLHAFLVGEQALPTEGRRALIERGVDRDAISFCGFWRAGAAQYAGTHA